MPSGGNLRLFFEWAPDPIVLAEQMGAAAAELADLIPPLTASREIAIADVAKHFATETAPDGSAWAPWAASYADYAASVNVGGILEQTDEMMNAVMSRGAWDITPSTLIFTGAGAPTRWIWHQDGASRRGPHSDAIDEMRAAGFDVLEGAGGNHLPARPFIGLDDDAQFDVIEIFDQWVSEIISFAIHPTTGVTQFRLPSGRFGPKVGLSG